MNTQEADADRDLHPSKVIWVWQPHLSCGVFQENAFSFLFLIVVFHFAPNAIGAGDQHLRFLIPDSLSPRGPQASQQDPDGKAQDLSQRGRREVHWCDRLVGQTFIPISGALTYPHLQSRFYHIR